MPIQRREFLAAVGASALAGLSGCAGLSGGSPEQPSVVGETLTLATTTSTYDTGLLDALDAPFENRYGVTVEAVAKGTGAALETARNGDADVVMVHARSMEDKFLRQGFGVNRRDLMFNDFVVVGPKSDPAGIAGTKSATEAFSTIAAEGAPFVSRGDNSGTHAKERAIWAKAGVEPSGDWYRSAGQGMGEVLNIASQQGAYTLSDRGTFLSQRAQLDLVIHVQGPIKGGPELLANPYGIVAVNPAVHEDVEYQLAMAYIGFVTSPRGQEIISNYEVNGQQLFYPEALSKNPNFQQYVPEGWNATSTEG